jgi:hypothetical protein
MKVVDKKNLSFKRKLKVGLATVAGATLGFIHGNIPGAIIGGYAGNKIADAVIDKDGNTKYDTDKMFHLGSDGLKSNITLNQNGLRFDKPSYKKY